MYILTCAYYDLSIDSLKIDYVKPFNTYDELLMFLRDDYKQTTSKCLENCYKSIYTYKEDGELDVIWHITSLSLELKGEDL